MQNFCGLHIGNLNIGRLFFALFKGRMTIVPREAWCKIASQVAIELPRKQ
jgi:uncharacterized protein YaiL (DUF2058 family)